MLCFRQSFPDNKDIIFCCQQVNISGAVNGRAEWPSDLKPVAWHRDSEMVRMKLGLYHSIHNVSAACMCLLRSRQFEAFISCQLMLRTFCTRRAKKSSKDTYPTPSALFNLPVT